MRLERRIHVACIIAASSLACSTNARAQRRQHLFAQFEGGFGYGRGGTVYKSADAFSVDLLIGKVSSAPTALTVALDLGAQGFPGGGDVCDLLPDGSCRISFPFFYSVSALFGRTWGGLSGLSATILAGPGYYRADEGGAALGISGRAQATLKVLGPIAATLSVKGAVIPNYRRDAFGLTAFGIGLAVRR